MDRRIQKNIFDILQVETIPVFYNADNLISQGDIIGMHLKEYDQVDCDKKKATGYNCEELRTFRIFGKYSNQAFLFLAV